MRSLALIPTCLLLLCRLALASPLSYPRQQTCNGNPDFCDRKYSNVSFIGTHDSPFVGSTMDMSTNQGLDVVGQLNAGIRFLQGQTHKNAAGDLHLCHTYCWLEDAGTLESYLAKVKGWMDANPNEVITILLVNGDFVDPSLFNNAFQGANLAPYAYVPSKNPLAIDDWPSLGSMIGAKKRLVVFLDSGADVTKVPYILPEFNSYFFETPYDTTDPSFPECTLDRPAGATPEGRMYIVNHFLDMSVLSADVPDNAKDHQTNAATGPGSIGAQASLCMAKYGRPPNFVLVDRFEAGDVFAAQKALNYG